MHLPALVAAGLLGVAEEDGRAVAYLPERVDGLPVDGEWAVVPDRDWAAGWRRGLTPVTVGAVTVVPPWLAADDGPPGGPVQVRIHPGQAFGTGHHETTAGCLAALQELDLRGRSVLDVGTGSGVLAIAAARLGAERVVAVDVDPVAVAAARDNVAANGVGDRVTVAEAAFGTGGGDGPADVVVANLDTATVVSLADALVAGLARGGTLVVSGVSVERAAEAESALAAAGLPVLARPGREWAVLTGRRSG